MPFNIVTVLVYLLQMLHFESWWHKYGFLGLISRGVMLLSVTRFDIRDLMTIHETAITMKNESIYICDVHYRYIYINSLN